MLNLRLAQPALLVDITRIPELAAVSEDADAVTIGATVTHAADRGWPRPDPTGGFLARVARGIAYRAVRTRGTIGGSLAHADPAADWLSCLTALGAQAIIAGAAGTRRVNLAGFVRGAMETEIGAEELLTAVRVPRFSRSARFGFHKICRKTGEFAEAIGVAVHDPERQLTRLAANAGAGPPIVIDARDLLLGRGQLPGTAELQERLAQAGLGGDAYDLTLHAVAVRRAIAQVWRMTRIALTVNGMAVEADVGPRMHLADFLREQLLLTGTHIGCEHGICGACTVEIDGEIARSCITYAVACDGAQSAPSRASTTTRRWPACARPSREAHALQCGYCTPGMLIAARDLVRRKAGLSRAEIRTEMSGNLCRCTGYQGIVDAIERVMAASPSPHASFSMGRGSG
jgi:carbon-monoxide dehydrogenase medium subunit